MSGEDTKSDCESSSWWGGWVQNAKEKSASVLKLVKKDLVEFSSVMQCDGSRMANVMKEKFNQETAASASKKVKEGMSTLWGGLSKALVVLPDDDDDASYEVIKITDGKPVVFDRAKAQLHTLQINITTYSEDPSLIDDKFQPWVNSSFDLEQVKLEISDLLVTNSNVRSLYTQLVPLKVSNIDFWSRYFYKKHLLDEEENRRVALVKRAEGASKDDLTWDEEEESPTKDSSLNDAKSEDIPDDSKSFGDAGSEQSDPEPSKTNEVLHQQPEDHAESSLLEIEDESDIDLAKTVEKCKTHETNLPTDEAASGESPDDWEKVCSISQEIGNGGSNKNEDWEEW